jgi:tetratricopeptide (TPR) repeat protein
MYYRYKVHKKNKGGVRKVAILVLISAAAYLGYQNRQLLFFWKYTTNTLQKKVESAEMIKDPEKKKESLTAVAASLLRYQGDNPAEVLPFLLSGRVNFSLGEQETGRSFTDLFIHEQYRVMNGEARDHFLKTIICIKKANALLDGEKLAPEYAMILARACFYTGFISESKILSMLNHTGTDKNSSFRNAENARFYAVMLILNNRAEEAIKFLNEKGKVDISPGGRMFLAAAENMAKQYTNSIMHYKNILETVNDTEILRLANFNLGKIYYSQSLYKESLFHFTSALDLNKQDISPKIWIGRNYYAMGMKEKARAVWTELLSADKENKELKGLLGIL